MREFTLNFPLYARIEDFALGLEPASKIEAPSPRLDSRPIVVYGTSIQQGCAASRPGLCHTNMLSRLLDRPFINLGFAGSGKGEPEVARVLATIKNPALYILDYDSNSSMESLEATLPGFTDILREAHPETPVLTVSQMRYPSESPDCPDEPLCCESRIRRTEIHVANMRRRRALSDNMVHFLDGIDLYGPEDFGECTIDGCHANDLGYYRISKAMAPEIRRILSQAV
jgi:lysophospholipase L1-like esterase